MKKKITFHSRFSSLSFTFRFLSVAIDYRSEFIGEVKELTILLQFAFPPFVIAWHKGRKAVIL